MSKAALDEAKETVIDKLLALAPRGWKRLFVDYEIQDVGDQLV